MSEKLMNFIDQRNAKQSNEIAFSQLSVTDSIQCQKKCVEISMPILLWKDSEVLQPF